MGFLDIFRRSDVTAYKDQISGLKEIVGLKEHEINKLHQEIKELKDEIKDLMSENRQLLKQLYFKPELKQYGIDSQEVKPKKVNKKLSPFEQKIFDIYNQYDITSFDDLQRYTKMKEANLRVYLSRIRKKGYEML